MHTSPWPISSYRRNTPEGSIEKRCQQSAPVTCMSWPRHTLGVGSPVPLGVRLWYLHTWFQSHFCSPQPCCDDWGLSCVHTTQGNLKRVCVEGVKSQSPSPSLCCAGSGDPFLWLSPLLDFLHTFMSWHFWVPPFLVFHQSCSPGERESDRGRPPLCGG